MTGTAAMSTPTYEETRFRHAEFARALLPEYVARIDWSREQIEAEQARNLRTLLAHAVRHSPWHRDRLRGIDLGAVTPATLDRLPVMTKADLVADWDAIVADPQVTLAAAEQHLESLETDAYFLDEYHVLASGGSSGQRGVFLWDWRGYAVSFTGMIRGVFRVFRGLGIEPPTTGASVSAYVATHATSAMLQTFALREVAMSRFPVSLPLPEIVAGLNRVQPVILHCYASVLPILLAEAEAGRLRISPRVVWPSSEPLLPEARAAAADRWKSPVLNCWNTTESMASGFACGHGAGHVSDDLNVVELVDEAGRPVPPGTRSARVLLTNVHNLAMPLIRYEITDEIVASPEPCPCGSVHTALADVQGRADDVFRYDGDLRVHPLSFRSPLGRERAIVEYQVRQTPRGAAIDVVTNGPVAFEALAGTIADALVGVGLEAPDVAIRRVDTIPRQPTGKLKRFVPLAR